MVMESDMTENHALKDEVNAKALGFTTSTSLEPPASAIRKPSLPDISIPIDLNPSDEDLDIPEEGKDYYATIDAPLSSKGSKKFKVGMEGKANTSNEGLEDWEDSPIAQQFTSLQDSNEIRKRNLQAAQLQGLSSDQAVLPKTINMKDRTGFDLSLG